MVTVLSSLFNLGIIMVGVIVGSKKTGINPDNVATPIAASFGDLITLAILAWISQGLYTCLGKYVSKCVCLPRNLFWVRRVGEKAGRERFRKPFSLTDFFVNILYC